MKNIFTTYILSVLLLFAACKKNELTPPKTEDIETETLYKDSISFVVNGKQYVCSDRYLVGSGNRQINLKPYSTKIIGRRSAVETGNFYYYGSADSTMYEAHFGFSSRPEFSDIKFIFSKHYRNSDLKQNISLLVPPDNSELLQLGKQSFSVDYEQENTTEGVALEARLGGIPGQLSTYIPGFSILIKTNLPKTLQDNSNFEIVKVQKLDRGFYLIEAKFELNLYDANAKLYRVEKGFMRLLTDMKVFGVHN